MKRGRSRVWVEVGLALAIFAGSLAFYLATGPKDLAWLEGAYYQRRVVLADVGGGPWDRPLFVLCSQPFLLVPLGSLAQRASLAAAVFAAGGCLFVYLLLRTLLEVAPQFIARRVAILTALTLGVSHTFWLRSVTPGPETLDALLLSAILFFLVSFAHGGRVAYLYTSMLLFGLSFSNNLMMLFFLPVLVVWVRVVRPPLVRDIGAVRFRGLLIFLAGAALAVVLAGWSWLVSGYSLPPDLSSWLTFWKSHMNLVWDAPLQSSLTRFAALFLYNFPPWTALIGLIGLVELFRRQKYAFWLVVPLLLVHSFLVATLDLSQPVPAYVPGWLLFSVAVGYGWWKVLAESTWRGFAVALAVCLSPLLMYRFAVAGLERIGQQVRARSMLSVPFETPLDALDHFLNPDRRYTPDAGEIAREEFQALPDTARIMAVVPSGIPTIAPLQYVAEVEHGGSGITFGVVTKADAEVLSEAAKEPEPPLFLAGLHPPSPAVSHLLDDYALVPTGYLFRVQSRQATLEADTAMSTQPALITGEWTGFIRPQGYALLLEISVTSDEVHSGRAVLNAGGALPFEGEFTRITFVGDSLLGRVSYRELVHIHIDAERTGNRLDGHWEIFEAPQLAGTFTLWKH